MRYLFSQWEDSNLVIGYPTSRGLPDLHQGNLVKAAERGTEIRPKGVLAVSGTPTSEKPLGRVTREPVHRQVQKAIRSYIVDNDLQPGNQLPPEGQMAELLGVSRNSVREGVKALEVQGVIEARVGAGLFVRSFSFDPILETLPYGLLVELESINHLLHLREVLDRGAVEQLVAVADDKQFASLELILDEWELAAGHGFYDPQLDRQFHQALYAGLENPLLSRIAGLFWDTMQRVTERSEFPHVENPLETLELHSEMVEALRARDIARMRTAIDNHYPGIWSPLL